MTKVLLVCGTDGCFKSCSAKGHAFFAAKGGDIVCSAETLLLRTAISVLENTKGLKLGCDASERGSLAFKVEVESHSAELAERLRCTADFIRDGISSLSKEYPGCVLLKEIIE